MKPEVSALPSQTADDGWQRPGAEQSVIFPMVRATASGNIAGMEISRRQLHHWTALRLELAGTPEFPNGSPSRALLLRLPFDSSGMLDRDAAQAQPRLATFRRFWSSEPDTRGHIVVLDGGLNLVLLDDAKSVIGTLRSERGAIEVGTIAQLQWGEAPTLPLKVVSLDRSAR